VDDRSSLVATLCFSRTSGITDTRIELFLDVDHKIGTRAERGVGTELRNDLRRGPRWTWARSGTATAGRSRTSVASPARSSTTGPRPSSRGSPRSTNATRSPRRPGTTLDLEPTAFAAFRPSYRCLAWYLGQTGSDVRSDLLGDDKPEAVARYYQAERAWLDDTTATVADTP